MAEVWTAATSARRRALGLSAGARSPTEVALRLADDEVLALIAEDHHGAMAMGVAVPARTDDGAGQDLLPGLLHVSFVAVRPDVWGLGLGEGVVRALMDEGVRQGFTSAQLWTQETNRRKRRLYERIGWTPTDRTKVDDDGEPIRQYVTNLRWRGSRSTGWGPGRA